MKKGLIIIFLVIVAFSACRKKPQPSWDVDLVTPLFNDTIFSVNLINDTLYNVDADHQLSFIFENELYEFKLDSLVHVPDTFVNLPLHYFLDNELTFEPGDYIVNLESFTYLMDFDNNEKLVELKIRSGEVFVEVNNQTSGDLLCAFSMNSATNEEMDTLNFNETFLSGEIFSNTYDFSKYSIDFHNYNGFDSTNAINCSFSVQLHPDEPEPVTFTQGDSIVLKILFNDIILEYAKGYFGQGTYSNNSTINYNFLEDWQLDGFSASQANVVFNVANYYGVDGSFKINELIATNTETGSSVGLSGAVMDSIFIIHKGEEDGYGVDNIIPGQQFFDLSASNMIDLIEVLPNKFDYSFDVATNLEGDTTIIDNFFYRDKGLKIGINAEITNGIMIDDLLFSNTMEWMGKSADLSLLDTLQNAKATFKVVNNMPLALNLDLILKQYEPIKEVTLLEDFLISYAEIDDEGVVIASTESITILVLTDELKTALQQADSVFYSVRMNTAKNQEVKLFDDNFMSIQLIGDFGLNLQF